MRCFLAVPVAEPALSSARAALIALRGLVADVRWARPETLHMTLHFFGSIEAAAADQAVQALTNLAERTQPFAVCLDTLGAFPPRGAPRVLWLAPRREEAALSHLAEQVRETLARHGFSVDTREYRGHCTLGRPLLPWPLETRTAWARARDEGVTASCFTADRIVLFESRPGPGGAVYTPRAMLPLLSRM